MKALLEFVKTTLIGGLLIVVPAYLTGLLLAKAIGAVMALLPRCVAFLREGLHHLGRAVALVLVVLVCFLLGLTARTRLGHRAIETFEHRVLERMPGFAMLRS